MKQLATRPFLAGLLAGIGLTLASAMMLALSDNDADNERGTSAPSRQIEPVFFITGDTINATLWRRNADGSLTCISRNTCRVPQRSR